MAVNVAQNTMSPFVLPWEGSFFLTVPFPTCDENWMWPLQGLFPAHPSYWPGSGSSMTHPLESQPTYFIPEDETVCSSKMSVSTYKPI
jgi:hypothetical protein